jgi:pantothenate synthetase
MRQKLGDGDTDAIRELGFNIKRIGIDVVRCAEGLRISSTIKKLGIYERISSYLLSMMLMNIVKI